MKKIFNKIAVLSCILGVVGLVMIGCGSNNKRNDTVSNLEVRKEEKEIEGFVDDIMFNLYGSIEKDLIISQVRAGLKGMNKGDQYKIEEIDDTEEKQEYKIKATSINNTTLMVKFIKPLSKEMYQIRSIMYIDNYGRGISRLFDENQNETDYILLEGGLNQQKVDGLKVQKEYLLKNFKINEDNMAV